MAKGKKIKIINLLHSSSGEFVTSNELAETLNISSRTIKRYLKDILMAGEDFGYKVVGSNKGYLLSVTDEELFNSTFEENGYNTVLIKENEISNERVLIISLILVLSNNVTMEEISQKMYMSKSTISKEILHVKKVLKTYNLKLNNKPYYGYFVEGLENDKRIFISSYLESTILNNCQYFHEFYGDDLNKYEDLEKSIISILIKNKIYKADNYIEHITKIIFTNIQRIKMRKYIDLNSKEAFTVDVKIVNSVKEIFKLFDTEVPMEEYLYISSILGNSYENNNLNLSGERLQISNETILDLMIICIEKINKIMKVDYTDDLQLINGLAAHIYSSIGRYSMEVTIDNPVLEMIKTKYIESYNCALLCESVIRKELKLSLAENDIGFIALHFAAANERKKGYSTRICVVCENGIGFSQLIKSKLQDKLSNVEIVYTVPRYIIDDIQGGNCDLLVTTVNIDGNKVGNKPIVKINYDLTEGDIVNIKEVIKNIKVKKYFFDRIPENLFFRQAEFKTKEELLDFVFCNMLQNGYITEEQIVDIMKREELSQTVINGKVALPHCLKTGDSIGAIVTLKKPIRWGNEEVNIVIISCINPKLGFEKKLFPVINKNTKKEENIEKLINTNTIDEFVKIITK